MNVEAGPRIPKVFQKKYLSDRIVSDEAAETLRRTFEFFRPTNPSIHRRIRPSQLLKALAQTPATADLLVAMGANPATLIEQADQAFFDSERVTYAHRLTGGKDIILAKISAPNLTKKLAEIIRLAAKQNATLDNIGLLNAIVFHGDNRAAKVLSNNLPDLVLGKHHAFGSTVLEAESELAAA